MSIRWATLLAAGVALASLGVLAVWGPAWGLDSEAHSGLLAFLGSLGVIVLSYMRAALGRFDDKD